MREKRDPQRSLQDLKPKWSKATLFAEIDQILSSCPDLCDLVVEDLRGTRTSTAGAKGMTAEQVLRVALVKQCLQVSYRDLWDRIDDSERLRSFCRFGDQRIPLPSSLCDNIGQIRPATWEAIHEVLVKFAVENKIERGRKVRIDTTGVETDIHHPLDSRLIEDCVRVSTRLMQACREWFGEEVGAFNNRSRAVKKRVFRIANTKLEDARRDLYRELLKLAEEVESQARTVRHRLDDVRDVDTESWIALGALKKELDVVLDQFPCVLEQTRRRVLEGDKVAASEKLFSIFEPHSDVIQKGQRKSLFGHKICLSGGVSNLILDCQIVRGNPSDHDLFVPALQGLAEVTGVVPTQVAADDGFASQGNARAARREGVQDVVFGGKLRNKLTEFVKSAAVEKQLRRFRAGIESTISAGKRAFGLNRCTWSGWDGFQSYVWLSVITWNLTTMARHLSG